MKPKPIRRGPAPAKQDKGCPQQLMDFYRGMCCDNVEAADFAIAWHWYCHEIDDIVDEKRWTPEDFLKVLVHASILYAKPFWRKHADVLLPHVATVTSMYADSVAWEGKDQLLWKRQAADVLRHAGIEMMFAIAFICGGFDNVRKHSAALRSMCWVNHHDEYGSPN